MISYGAVLGKVTPLQMLVLGILEPIFFWVNIYVIIMILKALDVGGGMTIHTMGAYFGLAVTTLLTSSETKSHKDNCSNYSSDTFSLAGTLFLWIMWPSFNAATAHSPDGELRAIVNTFLSLTGSVLSSFLFSRLTREHKFDVVHIQNSTLAGGVVMGVAADLNLTPAGSLGCGLVVGVVSVWGFRTLTPFLNNRFKIQDICGVHNLHGMPGLLSGVVGIGAAVGASFFKERYNGHYDDYFPRGDQQAGFQAAALGITVAIALAGGLATGLIMRLVGRVYFLSAAELFNDDTFWGSPSDYGVVVDKRDVPVVNNYGYELREMNKGMHSPVMNNYGYSMRQATSATASPEEMPKKQTSHKKYTVSAAVSSEDI